MANLSLRPLALVALLATLAACQSSSSAEAVQSDHPAAIRSRVALFRVDASELREVAPTTKDAVTAAILAPCLDDRLSLRLHAAIEKECGRGAVALLPRPFANDLDYAWDQEPPPQLAIVAKVIRREAERSGKVGGAIAGTVGWLLVGIPSLFIDDYDQASPIEIEIALFEGVARSDRNVGKFQVGNEPITSDFIDRNGGAPLPYVMSLLIPPHFVSAMDQDDPDAVAELILDAVISTAAHGVATRIRAWESPTGAGGD